MKVLFGKNARTGCGCTLLALATLACASYAFYSLGQWIAQYVAAAPH